VNETLPEFAARLRKLESGEMQKRLLRLATAAALTGEAEVKQNMSLRLRTRSGRLKRSGKGEVRTGKGTTLDVVISAGSQRGGAPLPYAGAQEYGATIRPKGRYLTIPLSGGPAVTPAGEARYTSARQAPNLVPWRSKSGRLFLVQFKPSGPELWYLLHPGPIQIKGKHFVRDAAKTTEAWILPRLARLLESAIVDS
jgi:hypothetical protein